MKRALYFATIMIGFDQIVKYFFQLGLGGTTFKAGTKIGFTFVVNPGIYVNQNISSQSVLIFQIVQLAALLIIFLFFRNIKNKFDTGLLLDISFGLIATGLLGNLVIDKIFFGVIRDYFITPMGVANFADVAGILGFLILLTELFRMKLLVSRLNISANKDQENL